MWRGYNVVRSSEKIARHNLELWKGKYTDEKPQLWHIFLHTGSKEHRRNPTWEAWVILDSRLHITDCKDPHFDDLLDDEKNYERLV
jgi:hypothetical protein